MRLQHRYFRSGLAAAGLLGMSCALAAGNPAPVPNPKASPPAQADVPVNASPTIQGLESAYPCADGALVIAGKLSGTGSVPAKHVIIEGELSPGHSPGCINFGGNVTFQSSATLRTEIGGTVPCTDYDRITVAGTLTLNSPTLEVVLINGFVPQFGDHFDVLDWGSLSGSFGAIDTSAATLPAPILWDTSKLYLTGELVVGVQHIADGDLAPWDNPDGNINAADVLIATRLVLGKLTPGALQYAHGDMDGDGDIDLADLLLIQQAVFQ